MTGEGLYQVLYNGSWETDPSGLLCGLRRSKNAGDSFTVLFNGSGLKLFSTLDENHGEAKITLDGNEQTVDLRHIHAVSQACIFEVSGLDASEHVLTVTAADYGTVNFEKIEITK